VLIFRNIFRRDDSSSSSVYLISHDLNGIAQLFTKYIRVGCTILSCEDFALEKKIITYSECVSVALGIQHAVRMHLIFVCGLSGPTMLATLFHKQQDFQKECMEHKMCVLIFSTILSEIFLILRRPELDMIINVYGSLCKAPVILVIF